MEKLRIVGMNIIKFVGEGVEGHNCDFEFFPEIQEKHILYGIGKYDTKYSIELNQAEGICGSGWTTDSHAWFKIREVQSFPGFSFRPKEGLISIEIDPKNPEDGDYGIFDISFDGGDIYYPCGGYHVRMDNFTPIRGLEGPENIKRKVYIFKGPSTIGKTFLAANLLDANLSVFETDSEEALPEEILEDIIVLGNKHNYSLEEVKERVFAKEESDIIVVDFSFAD